MKRSFALIAACLALAGNAHAVDGLLFGDSDNLDLSASDNNLTINFTEVLRIKDAGWYGNTGLHDPTKGADYMVGICSSCAATEIEFGSGVFEPGAYNNWFIVDISGFTPTTTVTSLTLTLNTFYADTAGTFKLWDYLGDIADLPKDTAPGAAGIAIYEDLGSGKMYGSFAYQGTESYLYRTITLSSDAIFDLNAAIDNGDDQWAIGGSFAPTPPIPEPETYALMLAGLGLVGWMAKRRKA
jgi:hypothetical protein